LLVGVVAALGLALPQLAAAALRYGSRGEAVRTLQRRLTALAYLPGGSVDGVFGDETWQAVVAFQGWQRIDPDGVVGPVTRHALARAQRPRPWLALPRALEIDVRRQVLLIVVDGRVERAVHASTASSPYQTPHGRFVVIRRDRESWSRQYHVWLPDALYFYRGWAIHGFPTVPDRPATHGCIRIPLQDAAFVFKQAPLGTPVLVRDDVRRRLNSPARR